MLFSLPFIGVGVWMCWSLGSMFSDAWQMRDWVPIEAELTRAGYTSHAGDDTYTYEAYAEYRYSYLGQIYTGNRVGLSSSADNIGEYQRDTGRRLSDALANGTLIIVYVDADDPGQAIIDRSLRWGLIGFKSIFLLIFGGAGLALFIYSWRAPKAKDRSKPEYQREPWLLNDAWQSATIRSGSKATMWAAWVFAGIWNLISAVMPFIAYREITQNQNYVVLVALLFPLVGIGLIVWAVRRTREWRRFGPTPVTLDPYPGSIGGHVGGTIDLPMTFDADARFTLSLSSIHSYISGKGKNRSRKEKANWQDSQVAHAESVTLANSSGNSMGTRLSFRFDVPEGLDPSDAVQDEDEYYLWRLHLEAELPGANLDRDYEIPVYPTATSSRHLSERSINRVKKKQSSDTEQSIRDRVNLRRDISGPRMLYPIGRNLGSSLAWLLFGGIFTTVGWVMLTSADQTVFGIVFGGIGLLIVLGCLYAMLNSLEISTDGSALLSVRRIMGIAVSRKRIPRNLIAKLEAKSSMQTQSGKKHVMHFSIHAISRQGDKMVVGEGFKGRSEADAATSLIAREFDLPLEENPPVSPSSGSSYGADVLTAD